MKRALALFGSVAVGFLIASVTSVPASELPKALAALQLEANAAAQRLVRPIALCVQRRDTGHSIFGGCIDWHSAVHGHWALIAYAARTGDRQFLPLVERGLTAERLAEERLLLRENPGFEMPYGRAWFLRLAAEHEALFQNGLLTAMAEEVARSLLGFLDKVGPEPFSRAYESQAWALINLLEYAERMKRPEIRAAAERMARRFIAEETLQAGCAPRLEAGNFMAVCSNLLWLAAKLTPGERLVEILKRHDLFPASFEPILAARNAHENGLNFSRAWGLWHLYQATGDPRVAELYARHVTASLSRPQTWDGDYRTVGHWVPQFGMLAIYPLLRE